MMKSKWLMLVSLLMAVFTPMGCAPTKVPSAEVPAEYRSIRMVGSSLGSKSSTVAMALATVFNRYYPDIEWSSTSGAAATNAIYIANGSVKVGMMNAANYVAAYGFDNVRESQIRSIILPTSLSQSFFLVPENKPWSDITQVPKGVNLSPGSPGAGTAVACEEWLKLAGLSKKDFNWVPMGVSEQADAWRAGKLDAVFMAVSGMSPALLDMSTSARRFKPMGLSAEQVTRARAEQSFERLGFTAVDRTNVVELAPDMFQYDVMAPQHATFLSCRRDFPDDIGYKMAKTIDEHRAELVQMYSSMKFATPEWHIQWARPPLDIHSGVAKYYREKGYLK